jgi:hypothetical protein
MSSSTSSNTWGQAGSMMNMTANGFNPFQVINFPDQDSFWVNRAQKASSLSNPFSGLSWSDPGQYQQMQNWSSWKDPMKDSQYQKQYDDKGYSTQQAKSMYQQPSGGDWSKYQQNLQQPGEQAAKTAYDQAMASIKGSAGASGMYGSSQMNKQANQGAGQTYTNALTSNASQAAVNTQQAQEQSNQYMANLANSILGNRMSEWNSLGSREMQSGLAENQFNQTQDSQKSSELQGLNSYNLNRSNSQNDWGMTKAQNEGKWNWDTMSYDNALEKSWWDDYSMNALTWDQTERDKIFKNYMTWWGMGNPAEEEARQNDTANAAAKREEDDGWGSIIEGGLGLLGKVGGYGTGGGNTIGGSLFSSIFG